MIGVNKHRFDRHGNVIGEGISRKRNIFDVLHSLPIQSPMEFVIWRNRKCVRIKSKTLSLPVQEIQTQPILRNRRYICFEGLVIQEICAEILHAFNTQYGIEPTILYRDFSLSQSRLIVTHVNQASQAEDLGLEVGDFVTHVNNLSTKTLDELESALRRNINKPVRAIVLNMASGAFGTFDSQEIDLKEVRIKYFGEGVGSQRL